MCFLFILTFSNFQILRNSSNTRDNITNDRWSHYPYILREIPFSLFIFWRGS